MHDRRLAPLPKLSPPRGLVEGKEHPNFATPLTEIALCGWVGHASPGDVLQYHRGHLGLDIVPQVSRLPAAERAELTRLARRGMWAAEQGLMHLLQRRHGPDDYAYLAVARPRPQRTATSLSELLAAPLA